MSSKITPTKNAAAACEIRTASFTLLTLYLRSTEIGVIAEFLQRKAVPGLFENEPVVLDIASLENTQHQLSSLPIAELMVMLGQHGLRLMGVRGQEQQASWAQMHGLVWLGESSPAIADHNPAQIEPELKVQEVAAAMPTAMIIDKPLRSGQQVYARGSDLIVMAAVNFGAEVIADGNIHIYAPLRGRAIAGAKGDTQARIFAMMMEPQLISIAGIYRTFEAPLASDVHAKAATVRLEAERLLIEPISS
jgi:septum site-determining protein MinC